MSLLIEVQLLDHTILLACDESSTVADVTTNALAEYRSFNLKASPQKVLYTKDSAGRVLSGSLKIIQNKIDTKLHVVVVDYNGRDSVNPAETLALYREWQVWTVNLLKENVQELSIREVPPQPDTSTLSLLFELCGSPSEAVQLLCVKVLQLLLTKFPQRSLVMEAAERICQLYATTEFADVAIAALESFKGLSPLQAKIFSTSRPVRDMFDLQSALARFPPDKQGQIFAAFEQISGILEDQELDNVLTKKGEASVPFTQKEEPQRGLKNVNFLENVDDARPGGDAIAAQARAESRLLESPLPTPPSIKEELPEPVMKRINLKRLESLLSSGDAKVRLYALEKLLKLLSLAAAGHRSNAHKEETVLPAAAPAVVESRAYELHEPPRMETVVGTAAGGTQAVSRPNSAYVFSFTDGKEVESLVKCLFRTLKECIHARPKRKPDQPRGDDNQSAGEDPSPVSVESKGEGHSTGKAGSVGGKDDASAQKGRAAVTAASTPGRLIQNALMSPQSDEPAVILIIDCIWQIVHFPCDVTLGSQFPKGLLQTHRRKLKMNGRDLSNIQLVFASAAREWYRLLLTLSHADEGSNLLRYADLAEKCAFFFVLVVLHGMERGWKESELTLEAAAIESFASGTRPNFRSYLGLTYLASLSACCFPDSTASGEAVWSVDRSQQQADSKEGRLLQEILLSRSFAVSKTLWRWATPSAEHRARRCSLLALDCISSCCVFSSFASFMYKLDPITRLASMLQLAVRDDKAERSEFSSGFEDSALSSSAVAGKGGIVSDDDAEAAADSDWDADKETFRMAVLANGEYADDEEESGGVGPTLDYAFPGMEMKGLGLSPRPGGAEPVIEAESALSRMMNRKGGVNDAAAAVAKRALAAKYVYPDVPMIRLILKTVANLLTAANSREAYSEAYRGEVGNWMQEVDVGPAGDDSGRVRLSRIAAKDQVVMFYYSIITRS